MALTQVPIELSSTPGIVDNSNATAITIDSSENVGIGTTSPNESLHVYNAATNVVANFESGDAKAFISFKDSSTTNTDTVFLGADGNNMAFYAGSASSERARIDASGNLLVGKTATGTTTAGSQLNADGLLTATRDGNYASILTRLNSDGDILLFRKDGSTVGSIGSSNGDLTIFSTAANHGGVRFALAGILPLDNSGALSDNTEDIGQPDQRFKDLYLSGGAYLGGTGSANKLDDYEEGTWTPTLDNGAGDLNATNLAFNASGRYTKIGRVVYITGVVSSSGTVTGTSSSPVKITGLPFTVGGISAFGGAFVDDSPSYNKPSVRTTSVEFEGSTTVIALKKDGTNNEANFLTSDLGASSNANRIYVSGFYTV
jgi:hypothetical protein